MVTFQMFSMLRIESAKEQGALEPFMELLSGVIGGNATEKIRAGVSSYSCARSHITTFGALHHLRMRAQRRAHVRIRLRLRKGYLQLATMKLF